MPKQTTTSNQQQKQKPSTLIILNPKEQFKRWKPIIKKITFRGTQHRG